MKAKEVLSRQDSIVQWQSVEVGIFSVEPAEPGAEGTRDPPPLKKHFFKMTVHNTYVQEANLFLQKAFYILGLGAPHPHTFLKIPTALLRARPAPGSGPPPALN